MNHYEARQQARRERLEAAAERAEARSARAYDRADLREEKSGIPLGQPILVGHHSEGRHRRAIARAEAAMRTSIDEDRRAGDLRAKAAGVGTAGISSDDPEALAKLEAKIAKLEAGQAMMREGNKIIRRWAKKGLGDRGADDARFADYLAELRAKASDKITAASAAEFLKPDFAGRIGFPAYMLSNNSAEIRRAKKRCEALEAAAERESSERVENGVRIVENAEANRLQLFFDGKPAEATRAELKSRGFRWARSLGCWQRHLNNAARHAAGCVLASLEE